MKFDDLSLASWTAAAAALGALLLKVGQWIVNMSVKARTSDEAFATQLRDELWAEVGRLRGEVDVVRLRADDCDERAQECQEENVKMRERADISLADRKQLTERVSQLEALSHRGTA